MTHFLSSAAIITSHPGKKRKNVEFSDKQMRFYYTISLIRNMTLINIREQIEIRRKGRVNQISSFL